MQKVSDLGGGVRQVHVYETLRPHKRPQDKTRDGSTLHFEAVEHHRRDRCPEAIVVFDPLNRRLVYGVQEPFSEKLTRPWVEGHSLGSVRVETLEHGGDFPDDMPQLIRVTDHWGRMATYRPVTEDGQYVDSKRYHIQSANRPVDAGPTRRLTTLLAPRPPVSRRRLHTIRKSE